MPRGGSLDGAVVVVTGASSGVGRATAVAFAGHHAKLVLAARGAEALNDAAAASRAQGADVLVVPTDITNAAAVEDLAERARHTFGRIDVWVEAASGR